MDKEAKRKMTFNKSRHRLLLNGSTSHLAMGVTPLTTPERNHMQTLIDKVEGRDTRENAGIVLNSDDYDQYAFKRT